MSVVLFIVVLFSIIYNPLPFFRFLIKSIISNVTQTEQASRHVDITISAIMFVVDGSIIAIFIAHGKLSATAKKHR